MGGNKKVWAECPHPGRRRDSAEREVIKAWIASGAKWGTDPIDAFSRSTERRAGNVVARARHKGEGRNRRRAGQRHQLRTGTQRAVRLGRGRAGNIHGIALRVGGVRGPRQKKESQRRCQPRRFSG